MGKKKIDVRIGEVILFAEQLVLVRLHNDHEITFADAKEQIEAALAITDGKEFVAVLDGGNTIDVNEEAMTLIARYPEKRWLAFAIVVRSISERLFANYYLMFKKPVRPTKVFTTPAGAEKWLKEYIKLDAPLKYDV